MPITLPPISRRQFLAGTLSAGVGLLLSRSLVAADRVTDANRFALLSDIHVWKQREDKHHGVKPDANFTQAAAEVAVLDPRPASMIISGDCVYLDGHAADYAVLADLVKPVRAAGIPIHFLMGNHDNRENFWAAFPDEKPKTPAVPDKHVAIVETQHANWYLLDSLERTRLTPGVFAKQQIEWLAKELAARPEKPALLVGHHNLGGPGGLRDTEGFLKVIAAHKNVKAYFYGHTHEWSVVEKHGIHLVNVPATAWLFIPTEPRGWVDAQLRDGGATLTLHALDKKHPKNGQRVELKWRTRG